MMNRMITHLKPEEIALCADLLQKHQVVPVQMQQHLDSCNSCKYELITVMELTAGTKENLTVQPQKRWWLTIAAVMILLIGTALYFALREEVPAHSPAMAVQELTLSQPVRPNERVENQELTDAVKPKESATEQLAVFTPDPQMEQLVDRFADQMRSEMHADHFVTQIEGQQLTLSWEQEAAEGLSFELYSNQGTLINTFEKTASPLVVPDLSKGLYYIKVVNRDFDLLQCIKFVVK